MVVLGGVLLLSHALYLPHPVPILWLGNRGRSASMFFLVSDAGVFDWKRVSWSEMIDAAGRVWAQWASKVDRIGEGYTPSILPRFDLGWLVTCNPVALDIVGENNSFAFFQGLIFTWHIHISVLSFSLMILCVDFCSKNALNSTVGTCQQTQFCKGNESFLNHPCSGAKMWVSGKCFFFYILDFNPPS